MRYSEPRFLCLFLRTELIQLIGCSALIFIFQGAHYALICESPLDICNTSAGLIFVRVVREVRPLVSQGLDFKCCNCLVERAVVRPTRGTSQQNGQADKEDLFH